MVKRLAALAALGLAAAGVLASDLGLYFGRCELASWAADRQLPLPPEPSFGKHHVEIVETRRVVPSDGLPKALDVRPANNNLDVVRRDDVTYLAFRSAPSHFAGSETVLHVLASHDERSWRAVARYAIGRDLREPRWLSLDAGLFLYVTVLGDDPFDFRPEGVRVARQLPGGGFGELTSVGLPGRVAWRTRVLDGKAYMTTYRGGENLYSLSSEPMAVELLTTEDGLRFRPVDPKRPVVSRGGGSEADFGFGPDGSLFAVVRNEAGDATGFGSKLCRAPRTDLGAWDCVSDPRKYDSPNVFSNDGELYVLARRHLTRSGHYAVATAGPELVRRVRNELAYIIEAKRCSLWRYDTERRALHFVLDLPSRGDTCFASVLPGSDPETLVVYDYSSDVDGPELPWSAGQRGPTHIYRHVLRFTAR